MKAKEFVKITYPTAYVEKHTIGKIKHLQTINWRVRTSEQYISRGETESKAWGRAKKFIIMREEAAIKGNKVHEEFENMILESKTI